MTFPYRGDNWGEEMTEALKLSTERGGIYNLFETGGELPEYGIRDIEDNGASLVSISSGYSSRGSKDTYVMSYTVNYYHFDNFGIHV